VCLAGSIFAAIRLGQRDHRVVADGPYRYVRHPSYSGLGLVSPGLGGFSEGRVGLGQLGDRLELGQLGRLTH
jgi:protein-S-isoprenylcysteine O-methyltransferase Ste14